MSFRKVISMRLQQRATLMACRHVMTIVADSYFCGAPTAGNIGSVVCFEFTIDHYADLFASASIVPDMRLEAHAVAPSREYAREASNDLRRSEVTCTQTGPPTGVTQSVHVHNPNDALFVVQKMTVIEVRAKIHTIGLYTRYETLPIALLVSLVIVCDASDSTDDYRREILM